MKKNNGISDKPIKRRYRLSFISENTLNELWSIRMTRLKAFIALVVSILAVVSLITTIIVGTPLRTLLPGYLKSEQRNQSILNSERLDSLELKVASTEQYFANLRNILNDGVSTAPIDKSTDTLSLASADSLLRQPSEIERQFVKEIDDEEKFNIAILTPMAAEGIVFAQPISGEVETFNPATKEIIVSAKAGSAVANIYSGSVIMASHLSENGAQLAVQHQNGFISVYKGLADIYVSEGDKVATGQRIATTSGSGLRFSIWHNGTAVNPTDYITF